MPCRPAGENIQAWLALAQAERWKEAWEQLISDNPHGVLVEGAGALGTYLIIAVSFVDGYQVGHLRQPTLDALELVAVDRGRRDIELLPIEY
jgi:hypothetical protein